MTDWLFDIPLALGLLWLGWRTVSSPTLFRAIFSLIVFGLLMALCWARLEAPDVALAEAAIGAGVTGALLLDAYRVIGEPKTSPGQRPLLASALALLSTVLVAGLGWALLNAPEPVADPGALVRTHLAESGVSNPVTAVLLNFRGYDTLLEVGVLLLALLGVWTINAGTVERPTAGVIPLSESPLIAGLIRVLFPLTVLIGAYLLWAGAHAPGGAFQAGAVLAGIGVLLHLSNRLHPAPTAGFPLRLGLILGLAVFTGTALVVMIWDGTLLQYPPPWAGTLILVIESTLTLSIALTLTLLFTGAPGIVKGRP